MVSNINCAMNFGKKNIQHSANYRYRNCAYKTSNIVPVIDAGISPGIMPEISKGTELGIVFAKRLS